jgi:hypothetical protein
MTIRYGMQWPEGVGDLDIELWCYAHDSRIEGEGGRLTKWDHFKNAVDMLWNREGSNRKVIWNEWTNRMLKAMIYQKYVGFAGAGNSGKSDAAAVFAIVDWLSSPSETLFLVCSTTTKGARLRIWKSITELWNALEANWAADGKLPPAKMVQSEGHIKGLDATGRFSDGLGILLIAAGKDDQEAADKKLKGAKAPTTQDPLKGGRLRLIADEFSDLGMCVYTALVGNLSGNEDFKAIGMSNPGSKLTPFGKFVTPKAGWNSLSVGMTEWETELGVCLSFDSYTSPRLTEPDGDLKYTWMQSQEDIDRMKHHLGEDSVEFWAQVRGMFCPTGMERTVWSELELLNAQSKARAEEWDAPPNKFVAALDPAFVTEGDRSPIMWGECGTIKQKKVLNILGYKIVQEAAGSVLSDDGEENPITVSENVINQFRDHCRFHGIPPKHAGFDGTGGGVSFGQWLHTKWNHAVHAIRFNEKPVDRRPDSQNEFTIYRNRVTQLWVQPKALVREGQIRGIPLEVIEELCLRKWAPNHTATTSCVESKRDMKKRIGRSPDLADTFVILVEVAILNGLLDVQEIRKDDRKMHQQWKKLVTGTMGLNPQGRKSLVAMPSAKRLKFSRRR